MGTQSTWDSIRISAQRQQQLQRVTMKFFILSVLVVCASAQYYPGYYGYNYSPYAYSGYAGYPSYAAYPAYPAYSSSQYHSQDELGQATYGYSYPGQASSTTRDAFGNQIGSYAYINAEGKEVRVSYVADANGFRVLSNDLPQAPVDNLVAPVFNAVGPAPVQDTPEVIAAKAEFEKLYNEAAAAAAAAPEEEAPEAAVEADVTEVETNSVEYTPEVIAARAEFFRMYNEAAAAAAAPEERSVLAYSLPLTATLPAYAKSTVKTAYYEANEAALTPAATTKIDLKEQEHEILTPVAYHTPLSYRVPVVSAAPVATRVLTTSPYLGYGYHVIG